MMKFINFKANATKGICMTEKIVYFCHLQILQRLDDRTGHQPVALVSSLETLLPLENQTMLVKL